MVSRLFLLFLLVLGSSLTLGSAFSLSSPVPPDSSFSNSLGMTMVRIPAGHFFRGSTSGDFDEVPVHKVDITQAFYLATTEVTNAQYEQFDPGHKKMRGGPEESLADNEPVVNVSWEDAQKFCAWLSKKEEKPYRLPTEAEWEYACRAGTKTAYSFGEKLPAEESKGLKKIRPAGQGKPNPWGLFDLHGNVEEWCQDWYGPYEDKAHKDPVGPASGDFRVCRGGSHSTTAYFLRSANRLGTLPDDKNWLLGFRVVQGARPTTRPTPVPPAPLWGQKVRQDRHNWKDGPDLQKPYFRGPLQYVDIPANSNGPLFSRHNHQPAVTACPNGDLLAIWYSCNSEPGRELGVVASRLRLGAKNWDPATPFWDAPDRNDHGNALLWDGEDTLYHFNGLSVERGWGELALIVRTSRDNGATWSKARIIAPEHKYHHQVIEGAIRTREGYIVVPCDAVPGGTGGSVIHLSKDGGKTWLHPAAGQKAPQFSEGGTGSWIAGIHAGVAQFKDGGLLALGRGDTVEGKLPWSKSSDWGKSWTYGATPFPPLGGGQRLILERLQEGPLLVVSFAKGQKIKDAAGKAREVSGMFAALSYDEGKTWPVRKLITDGGPERMVDGGGNTRMFKLGPYSSEPRGYLTCTQAPDGVIHLLSSKQHYAFNLKWLETPAGGN